MIFKQRFLDLIAKGEVSIAFRRWTRPSVKPGGTLLTPVGQLRINSVTRIDYQDITDADVLTAGYTDRTELDKELRLRKEGEYYRVSFVREGEDPRIELRESGQLSVNDFETILATLDRLDRGKVRNWTRKVLDAIEANPGLRAADLSVKLRYEKDWLKPNIRKLKNLGLTISLEVGYEISPRGKTFLRRWRAKRY